jgi:MFS-type transporter involved in bile tolerance (Atg22 family)
MIGFSQGIFFSFVSGSSQVFIEVYGLSAWTFGMLFAIGAMAWTVSAQLAPWLMHRLGPERVITICALTCVLITLFLLSLTFFALTGCSDRSASWFRWRRFLQCMSMDMSRARPRQYWGRSALDSARLRP